MRGSSAAATPLNDNARTTPPMLVNHLASMGVLPVGVRLGTVVLPEPIRGPSSDVRKGDAAAAHTSYALQNGYEGLIGAAGAATGKAVAAVRARLELTSDPRDVLAARD